MSRSLVKPSVTPFTAFWASARAIPWKARCWRSSSRRVHVSSAPESANLMPGGTGVWSLPFGPWTSIEVSPTLMLTPLGTSIFLFPTRDMSSSSPHVAEDLAAHALSRRRPAGHDPAGGGEDVDAEAPVHPGNLVLAAVDPAAGTAHALEVGDHLLHARAVLQEDADAALLPFRLLEGLVVRHVALVLEDARDIDIQLRGGNVLSGKPGPDPVPDPGDHVRDGIGHVHRVTSTSSP